MDIKTVKKRLKAVIGRSRLLKALIMSMLAVLFSCVVYCVFGRWLPYIGIDNTNLSYLQEYYKSVNSTNSNGSTENYYTADSIYILDIDDNITRDSLAAIIEDVMEYKPKVIGIDILFKINNSSDTLKNTIYKHADSIVIAQVVDNDGFFKTNLFDPDEDYLHYGIVNSYDFESYNPKTDYYLINGKNYYHFAYEISKMFNPKLNIKFGKFIINYTNTKLFNTDVWNFYGDPKDSTELRIKDKIVLIGNSESLFDIHPMPFVIKGDMFLSGIHRHAYAINSLISENVAMKRMPIDTGWNVLLYFVMSYLYSLLYVYLTDKKKRFVNRHETAIKLIRPSLLIIVVPILLLMCYVLTRYFNIIPNVVLFLITVFIINTFNDFLEQNINSKEYEKEYD